ncbi:TetR/AcrR family transcriptional regulator [Gordonia sp. CPCC 205515]|uniref:TetR/AcrR family transcriptional regulator n=1 Tax=Gordonia sp. CPCC 205515 TaxID=3140791 RepID=UPI003AF3E1B2
MAPKGTRAENRAAMESEIRRLGREHLSTHGAAGLSLRAIARDLGVVSSAVYRYVPSRDDLLTALLVEGYTDLADAVDAAVADVVAADRRARLLAAAEALRAWAVADPARWALLYGSPVPGYAAPAEVTVEPGTRVIGVLIAELGAAHRTGLLREVRDALPPATLGDLDAIRTEFGSDLPDAVLAAGITVWAVVIGGTSLEVFGQYGSGTFTDPAGLFRAQVDGVLGLIFAA